MKNRQIHLATFLVTAALLWAQAAVAHAVLVDAVPGDGAILAVAPRTIDLRFNEPVKLVFARILDTAGRTLIQAADVTAHGTNITIRLHRSLAVGTYFVSYRVVSADGHPVGGAFPFTVGAPGTAGTVTAPSATADTGAGWEWAVVADRAVQWCASLLALGAGFFVVLFDWRDHERVRGLAPLIRRAATVAIAAAILAVGLQGGYTEGLATAKIRAPDAWLAGLATSRLQASICVVAGFTALIACVYRIDCLTALRRWGVVAAGATVIAGFLLDGHAATATPRPFALAAIALHTAIAAFWIGSLMPLLRALDGPRPPRAKFRNFSAVAIIAVPAMVLCGLALAVFEIPSFAVLMSSDYGTILCVKIAATAVMLALAGLNRFILTPGLATAPVRATAALRRVIGGELALGLAIVALTALLSETAPPRTVPALAAPAVEHLATTLDYAARIALASSAAGARVLTLRLFGAKGLPLDARELRIELSNPAAGIETIVRRAERIGPGIYRYSGHDMLAPGRWHVSVEALINDFDVATFESDFVLAPTRASQPAMR